MLTFIEQASTVVANRDTAYPTAERLGFTAATRSISTEKASVKFSYSSLLPMQGRFRFFSCRRVGGKRRDLHPEKSGPGEQSTRREPCTEVDAQSNGLVQSFEGRGSLRRLSTRYRRLTRYARTAKSRYPVWGAAVLWGGGIMGRRCAGRNPSDPRERGVSCYSSFDSRRGASGNFWVSSQ